MKLLEQLPEKLLGWISRRNSFVKIILSIGIIWTLIAVIPGTIALIKHVENFLINLHTPTGSPVIVSGGSLYGVVSPPKVTWVPASICSGGPFLPDMYCAHLINGDSYLFSSVGFNAKLTSPTISTQSWEIFFPDTKSTSPVDPDSGLRLCSNPTCSLNVGATDDPHYIYLALTDIKNSQWENKGPTPLNQLEYLFFHDTHSDCDNASTYGGSCDVLKVARVFIAGSQPVNYTCQHVNYPGQCAIGIGNPAVQLSNAVALYKKFF